MIRLIVFSHQIQEAKNSSGDSKGGSDRQYRLLGELPTLGPNKEKQQNDVKIALSLEIHNNIAGVSGPSAASNTFMKADAKSSGGGNNGRATPTDPTIPQEFLCAINGHVMKEPVRVRSSGLVFELATIDLWLQTRGAVCPITNTHLERSDLEPADDLRNRYIQLV